MSSKTILLVDDDPDFVAAMSSTLCAEGYDVVTAQDGAAAISALKQGKPDLIILAILFAPDVAHGGGVSWDGFMIIDWLRGLEHLENTPVVLIAPGDPAPYAEGARQVRAAGLFQKTVEPAVWIGLVHRLLAKPSVAAQSAHDLQACFNTRPGGQLNNRWA